MYLPIDVLIEEITFEINDDDKRNHHDFELKRKTE